MVVTGGGYYYGMATVQVYTISGPQEQLPDMLQGRNRHACAHYVDSQNRVVSMIPVSTTQLLCIIECANKH